MEGANMGFYFAIGAWATIAITLTILVVVLSLREKRSPHP